MKIYNKGISISFLGRLVAIRDVKDKVDRAGFPRQSCRDFDSERRRRSEQRSTMMQKHSNAHQQSPDGGMEATLVVSKEETRKKGQNLQKIPTRTETHGEAKVRGQRSSSPDAYVRDSCQASTRDEMMLVD
jgi:hypothetical protein